MHVELRDRPFEPYAELQAYETANIPAGKFGATGVFVGTMRDFNEGDAVQTMWLEHYPGMTEKYLQTISIQAAQDRPLLDSLIIHRIGHIEPADPIVLVAVWSAHRSAAFDAVRFLMEELKSKAPFWKKETLTGGDRWVEKNTPG
ncbi:MAG: molybdenum cofactor biosynthesis protein MoaE [Gammaproteobacteria bacterium]|nr:molybdenum cofactor biosynthesis protein MoaE [Gammaproteobacteria bacterium]